jgi:FeS assembly SUF system protein
MNILNLNDVPPPETPAESTRPPERPAAPATSSLDLSALTAPAPADAAEATTEQPVQTDPLKTLELTPKIVEQLSTVYDPEIPVNLYDLGLIYRIQIDDENAVEVDMTLTAPGCPVAGEMPGMVAEAIEPLPGVKTVDVQLVWDPPWDMSRMTDEARMELGFY